jgi:hypothetical protein
MDVEYSSVNPAAFVTIQFPADDYGYTDNETASTDIDSAPSQVISDEYYTGAQIDLFA